MTKHPYHKPTAESWSDDAATVIYGDDLLEDFDSSSPDSGAATSVVSAPPRLSAPAVAAPPVHMPDSGLDSLRPYVGTAPSITHGGEEAIDVSIEPVPPPASPSLSFAAGARWFTLGIAAACALFTAGIIALELSPEPKAAATPTVIDGDKISPVADNDILTRAAEGEPAAVKELGRKEPTSLSSEELLALSLGEEARAQEKTAKEIRLLAKKKTLTHQDREDFFAAAGNERTYRHALLAMARNESHLGPDLIYEATRRFRHQKDVSEFAMQVLLTPQVYKYASPALTVVIDAEAVTGCANVRDLVERTAEDGDSRAVRHMARFAKRNGCGEDGLDDCYPCLRGDRALVDALRAAQDRMPPR